MPETWFCWYHGKRAGSWESEQETLLLMESGESSNFPLSLLRHHPSGEGGLVTAWVGVEVQDLPLTLLVGDITPR